MKVLQTSNEISKQVLSGLIIILSCISQKVFILLISKIIFRSTQEETKAKKEEVKAVKNITAISGDIGSPMSGVETDTDKFKEPEVLDISTPPTTTTRNKSTKDDENNPPVANNISVSSEEAKSVRKSSRILDAQSASDTENISVTNITEIYSDTDTSNRMDTSQVLIFLLPA